MGLVDIFEEVESDLRADRMRALLRRYGWWAGAGAIVVVLGILAWQGTMLLQARQQRHVAQAYFAAVQELGGTNPAGNQAGGNAKAEAAFAGLSGNSTPAGYRTLARLRAAELAAGNGQLKLALSLWKEVATDPAAGPLFAGLARLLWVTHQIDGVKPGSNVGPLEAELEPLLAPGNPWRPMAEEASALISLARGDKASARKTLAELRSDPSAPQGLRGRAAALMVQLSE